jgi:hypothetical protein
MAQLICDRLLCEGFGVLLLGLRRIACPDALEV